MFAGKALTLHPVQFKKLIFLGTCSATPTRTRNVSGSVLSFDSGSYWLFDCGEGTQHQIIKSSVSHGKIDKIFITHLHGDHCFGLPGLMCTMSMSRLDSVKKRSQALDTEPSLDEAGESFSKVAMKSCLQAPENPPSPDFSVIDIFGPYPLSRYLRQCLSTTGSYLCYYYRIHEVVPTTVSDDELYAYYKDIPHPNELTPKVIRPNDGKYVLLPGDSINASVQAAELTHSPNLTCLGYTITEPTRPGTLDVQKAKEAGIPVGKLFRKLKDGESATLDNGKIVHPSEVLGPEKPGRKVVILGDTCDSRNMIPIAAKADVVVHESTFGEEHTEMALAKFHSTAKMAGSFAKQVDAGYLILTHFSARFANCDSKVGIPTSPMKPVAEANSNSCTTTDPDRNLPLCTECKTKRLKPSTASCFSSGSSSGTSAASLPENETLLGLQKQAASALGKEAVLLAYDFFEFEIPKLVKNS